MRLQGRLAPVLPVVASVVAAVTWRLVEAPPEPVGDALLLHLLGAGLSGHGEPGQTLAFALDGIAIRGWLQASFLATAYALIGEPDPTVPVWAQSVIVLPATTALVFGAGRLAFDRRVGLVAAWLFALWFPLVYHSGLLLPETMLGLLAAVVVALLAAVTRNRNPRTAAALGLAIGLLSLAHPAWQFVTVTTLVALLLHFVVLDRAHGRLLLPTALAVAAVLVPYAAVRVAADVPQLGEGARGYGGGGGWTFWVGSRSATGFLPTRGDYTIAELNQVGAVRTMARLILRGRLDVDEHLARVIAEKTARTDEPRSRISDSEFYRAGIDNLLDDPWSWPDKAWLGVTTIFLPADDLRADHSLYASSRPPRLEKRAWRVLAIPLAVAALLGIVLASLRSRDRLVVFAPLIAQAGVFVVGTPEPRYGYPLMSGLFILAGFGLVRSLGWLRHAHRRAAPGAES